MNPRVRRALIWAAYPTFYLLCFVVFAFVTFPFDRLRDRIVVGFAEDQRRSGGTMQLEIGDMSWYWLSGIEAENVRLITPASTEPDGTIKPASEMEVPYLAARVSLLPLVLGRFNVSFKAEALGGSLHGTTHNSGADRALSVDFDNVALGRFQPLVQMLGLPMSGELNGHVDLTIPEGKLSKADGTIDLTIANLTVADGKAKIKDTIALPKLVVGDLVLKGDVSQGVMRITKFAAAGHDLDFSSDGKVTLRDELSESQADLNFKFKFSDKYKSKDDKTQALFGAPGSSAPALFEIADPKIRQAKRPDGFYAFRAWGLLRSLRFDPAAVSPTPGRSGAGNRAGGLRGFSR